MNKLKNNEQGMSHLWILLLAIMVAVGGVGYYVAKHNSQSKLASATVVQTVSQLKPISTDLNSLLPVDKVKQLAEAEKPGAVVSQVGLVQTSSGPVFHVELEDGTAIDLNAKTGTKVDSEHIGDNSEGKSIPASFTPAIDFAKAQAIAQSQVTQGTIMRIQLELENGVAVYSVRFSTGAKVEVNATDGSVVKVVAEKANGKQPITSGNSSSSNKTESTTKTEQGTTQSSEGSGGSSGSTSHQSEASSSPGSTTTNTSPSVTPDSSGHGGSSGSGGSGN